MTARIGSGSTPARREEKVLLITGGLLDPKITSITRAARKLFLPGRRETHPWFSRKMKLVVAEPVLYAQLERLRSGRISPSIQTIFRGSEATAPPQLTEVVLSDALRLERMPFEVATYDDLFGRPDRLRDLLEQTTCVFASSTLLHDLGELEALIGRLKRPHNRVVVGGALAGIIAESWQGSPRVDLLAVGYGEMLVPALVKWMRDGYQPPEPPPGGRIERRGPSWILHSGTPASRDLDFLPTPDWARSQQARGSRYDMIYYESVRGCPYRCRFCNYPYLFDDNRFRYKSARRIADDWEHYVRTLGIEYITCLDSLFTMPKRRLLELCDELIRRQVRVKWICYARADDLCDEAVVKRMREAGAHQVHIGIESGDQRILDHMNKRTTVEANRQALLNCRKHGLTSIATFIIGFPGETGETVENTWRFFRESPPDFYFLAAFSTRVAGVPILNPANRARFGLEVLPEAYTMLPYWRHGTMRCSEVGDHIRALQHRLSAERVALNAAPFYAGILHYEPGMREELLELQRRAVTGHPLLRRLFGQLNRWVDRRLEADLTSALGAPALPGHLGDGPPLPGQDLAPPGERAG